MRHSSRYLPEQPIEPTHTPGGITVDEQRELLQELRSLQNAIPAAQFARDDRLVALALSGSVSRRDMARACGLNKSRVDQIIAAHVRHLESARSEALRERMNRHMAPKRPSP